MKIKKIFASLLPGIFILGFNIGTGSVTAMAKAGAGYGMSLLWTILLSCVVTWILLISFDKLTLSTGLTALQAIRRYIHPALGIFFIVSLTIAVCGSVIGVMGIISDICQEWSKTWINGGIDSVYFALIFILLVYIIFWNGRTDFFQRALAIMVAIMAASFIINFFIMAPDIQDILSGLIPNIPDKVTQSEKTPFLVIASMVGTTVFSGLFIIRTTLVKEAKWTWDNLREQRRDALLSVSMMFIISAAIMASAAGTLYVNQVGLTEASQMVTLLEPFSGKLAVTIFVFGIVAAGVSSQFPNVLMLPWLLCDYLEKPREMHQAQYRIMVLFISLLGLIVPVFKAPPVFVMIASQVFSALILPVTVLSIIYLTNSRNLMGAHKSNTLMNTVLFIILIFAIYMSFTGLKGILEYLTG
jgi:Mn2+/Fe2+ NRAMP family transporter